MAKKIEKKPFYKSKTKWAALLIGIGPVLATIGAIINGQANFMTALPVLAANVGVVLAVFGIRDLPFINRIK